MGRQRREQWTAIDEEGPSREHISGERTNEKYSYLPLIIGHFHVNYMNFKLCDNFQ